MILRRGVSKWLMSSIESGLDLQFVIWNLDFVFHDFSFFKHSSARMGY